MIRKPAWGFLNGLSFEEFCIDRKTYSAVIREFEIIGEAVGKLPDELKQPSSGVEWQDIKVVLKQIPSTLISFPRTILLILKIEIQIHRNDDMRIYFCALYIEVGRSTLRQ